MEQARNHPVQPPLGDLVEAFATFGHASNELTQAYGMIERRVAELTAALAHTRSERAAETAERQRLEARHAQLLRALPAAVVVLNGDGVIQETNPAAESLLGAPLSGVPWRDIIARAFAPRLDDGHEVSLHDGRRVSIAISPLGNEPGQIVLLHDLTETRRLQERLGHHQRLAAMGEMAAALAHQIRTPLATALLFAAHLSRPGLKGAEFAPIVARVKERLHHLEQLVNDMLVFARGGALHVTPLSAAALIAALQAALAPLRETQPFGLTVDNEAGEAAVLASTEALASAFLNLASNALQARTEGLELRLRTAHTGEHIEITLTDNGPGIPAALRARVFEPFFTTRAQGTGLGLAVVRAIAEAHGGVAWVESPPGEGATFGIRLPIAPSRVESRASSIETAEAGGRDARLAAGAP